MINASYTWLKSLFYIIIESYLKIIVDTSFV